MSVAASRSETAGLFQALAIDPVLADRLSTGLIAVEESMRETVRSPRDERLTEAATHLIDGGGKRLRPLLALAGAEFGDPRHPDVVRMAMLIELTHVASLYHDDVMDQATTRRGRPTANQRWGNTMAVLVGDYMLARAAEAALSLSVPANRLLARSLGRLVQGQYREARPVPLEGDERAHCLAVMSDKTATLFSLAVRLGATAGRAPEPLAETLEAYGESLGVAFQLSDDILDIIAPTSWVGKQAGNDLRVGVRSLPIVYALQGDGRASDELRELLSDEGVVGEAQLATAMRLVEEAGGVRRAHADLRHHAGLARSALATVPDIPARHLLHAMVDWVIRRCEQLPTG